MCSGGCTLGRYSGRIERVAFLLEKVECLCEGLEYKSRIRVEVAPLPPFVIEDGGAYLWIAVDRVADRAGRKLARAIYGEKGPGPFRLDYAVAPRFTEWIASRGSR